MTFELHPQLKKDTVRIAENDFCVLLLSKDSSYPWVILVPKREDISEIHQLTENEQQTLMSLIGTVSASMETIFNADKINVAALGNIVPQLHIHIVVRYKNDTAWPGPIWGVGGAVPYDEEKLQERCQSLGNLLN